MAFPWQRQEAREEKPGEEGEGERGGGITMEEQGRGEQLARGAGEWGQQRDGEVGLGFGA